MSFYGSALVSNVRLSRPARHIACPQRLKYIHDIKHEFIPCVEDSSYFNRNISQNSNRLSLYNTADAWRRELMGLAQQVQSSLVPPHHEHRPKRRSSSSLSTYHLEDNDEQNISKRLLHRRPSACHRRSYTTKPKISIDKNEQELSTNNENQDPGIWLLPMLCHTLQVDNIFEAQEWLVNANPTEKRLAMELISRTMHDMQYHENDFLSDCDQSPTSSNMNNIYWPYKFWQYQQQSKFLNDTCERATSPVRFLTPARRLSTSLSSNQRPQTSLTESSSIRLFTPIAPNTLDRQSRRSHRVTTSRSSSSTNLRGKTPLI